MGGKKIKLWFCNTDAIKYEIIPTIPTTPSRHLVKQQNIIQDVHYHIPQNMLSKITKVLPNNAILTTEIKYDQIDFTMNNQDWREMLFQNQTTKEEVTLTHFHNYIEKKQK